MPRWLKEDIWGAKRTSLQQVDSADGVTPIAPREGTCRTAAAHALYLQACISNERKSVWKSVSLHAWNTRVLSARQGAHGETRRANEHASRRWGTAARRGTTFLCAPTAGHIPGSRLRDPLGDTDEDQRRKDVRRKLWQRRRCRLPGCGWTPRILEIKLWIVGFGVFFFATSVGFLSVGNFSSRSLFSQKQRGMER